MDLEIDYSIIFWNAENRSKDVIRNFILTTF